MSYTDEKHLNWPDIFYETFDPLVREKLLREHLNTEADQERLRIFEKRYAPVEKNMRPDLFLRAWISIFAAGQSAKDLLWRKKSEKQIHAFYESLCVFEPASDFLKAEWNAFANAWIDICLTDTRYGSSFFGFGRMSQEAIADKIRNEIYVVMEEIPMYYGFQDSCETLKEILYQAFFQKVPGGKECYDKWSQE